MTPSQHVVTKTIFSCLKKRDALDMTDRQKLKIDNSRLKEINEFLLRDDNPLVTDLLKLIEKYGGVDEINKKA